MVPVELPVDPGPLDDVGGVEWSVDLAGLHQVLDDCVGFCKRKQLAGWEQVCDGGDLAGRVYLFSVLLTFVLHLHDARFLDAKWNVVELAEDNNCAAGLRHPVNE